MPDYRLTRLLLVAYPPSLRRAHGEEMVLALSEAWRREKGLRARARLAARVAWDVVASWSRAPRRRERPRVEPGRGRRWPGHLASDLKQAFRLFAQSPWFALGAVITLGLGIGSVTAIFSLADATLLRPFPFPAAERVVQARFAWSQPDYRDFAERQQSFSAPAAWTNVRFALEQPNGSRAVNGAAVSGSYFAMVGISPVRGRLLSDADDRLGAPNVAVLSERLWQRDFGARPDIVGSTIHLNRRPLTVVGISPAAFRGVSLTAAPELFVPIASLPSVGTGMHASRFDARSSSWLQVGGRLRDGVRLDEAAAEVETIFFQLHPQPPGANSTNSKTPMGLVQVGAWALPAAMQGDLNRFVLILFGATLVTLLLACATVATLLLMRAERRQRELAVRAALGAGRWTLMRMLLVESVAIGVAGSLAGLLVAWLGLPLFATFSLPGRIAIGDLQLNLNPLALGLAVALGLATSLIFGLAPLWHGARIELTGALRDGSRGTPRQRARTALVGLQVAVCTILLAGSFAFGRALRHGLSTDLGFEVDRAVLVSVDPQSARYVPADILQLQQRMLDTLTQQPWVDAAGWSSQLPLQGRWTIGVKGEDRSRRLGDPRMGVDVNLVSPGYFDALRIPLVAGRAFTAEDRAGAPPVVIVNERLAKQAWPDGQAIGHTLTTDMSPVAVTVVGVARNLRRGITNDPDTFVYLPAAQYADSLGVMHLVVRPSLRPDAALVAVRDTLRQTDPLVPVSGSETMPEHLRAILMPQRLGMALFALFAGVAVTLTAFGLYGVIAYAVAHRFREIGIRVALGAEATSIVRLVVRQGLTPVAAGLTAGTIACLWGSRSIAQFLFAVPAFSVWTFFALVASLALVAVSAMWLPARRALAVDPASALRRE
jgi:predicted permease